LAITFPPQLFWIRIDSAGKWVLSEGGKQGCDRDQTVELSGLAVGFVATCAAGAPHYWNSVAEQLGSDAVALLGQPGMVADDQAANRDDADERAGRSHVRCRDQFEAGGVERPLRGTQVGRSFGDGKNLITGGQRELLKTDFHRFQGVRKEKSVRKFALCAV
jgi:hypothetical protein